MHVSRLGLTPLKGTRHRDPYADLTLDGPVGDRVLCLVDRARGRVVRTVENPTLMRPPPAGTTACSPPSCPAARSRGRPSGTGEMLEVDYWGPGPAGGGHRPVGGGVRRAGRARRRARPGPRAPATSSTAARQPGQQLLAGPAGRRNRRAGRRRAVRMTFTLDTTGQGRPRRGRLDRRRVRGGEAKVEVRSGCPGARSSTSTRDGERRPRARGLGDIVVPSARSCSVWTRWSPGLAGCTSTLPWKRG